MSVAGVAQQDPVREPRLDVVRLGGRGHGRHFLREHPHIDGEHPQHAAASRHQPLQCLTIGAKSRSTALDVQREVACAEPQRMLQTHGAFPACQTHGQAAAVGVAHHQRHAGAGREVNVSIGLVGGRQDVACAQFHGLAAALKQALVVV
ncbi:hypothetical protein D9M68_887470 [compost metagenome]